MKLYMTQSFKDYYPQLLKFSGLLQDQRIQCPTLVKGDIWGVNHFT